MKEDASQVHDQAHRPQEEQLRLAICARSGRISMRPVGARRQAGTEDGTAQGHSHGEAGQPWASGTSGPWALSGLSFPSRGHCMGPGAPHRLPSPLPTRSRHYAGPSLQCQTPACQLSWVQPPPSRTAALPLPPGNWGGSALPQSPLQPGLSPIMSRILWWLEMMWRRAAVLVQRLHD